jgi:hypothetical protein
MKFAMIWDYSGYVESFYVKDKTAYNFKDDKPYMYTHAVSPECFLMGPGSFPFLWEDGCFINLHNWYENIGDELPNKDFDIIFYACEGKGLLDENFDKYRVGRLREKYPDSKIVGWIKEIGQNFNTGLTHSVEKYENRIKILNECDAVLSHGIDSMRDLTYHKELNESIKKELQFLSVPLNIEYMYDNFYSDTKENSIYAYLPHQHHRRGDTYEFVNYISNKYNIPIRHKPLQEGQKFDYLTQKQFIELWSPSLFHFNLDPTITQPGMQCRQVASVGSIHIGGLNESHGILYPETATNDKKILEERFVEYLNDEKKRFEVIEYAWNKLNEVYSHNSVKKQISEIVYE